MLSVKFVSIDDNNDNAFVHIWLYGTFRNSSLTYNNLQ